MRINALKLQILMAKHDLSVKKLAENSKVSRQTISCIKSGKGCSPQVAYKLSEALGVKLEELLED